MTIHTVGSMIDGMRILESEGRIILF
uniref:Uncharacterized protein n=1 Tax=Rhizophora mucronata TaxID=61149 RepID=A0A2P2Q2D3_RHIMU